LPTRVHYNSATLLCGGWAQSGQSMQNSRDTGMECRSTNSGVGQPEMAADEKQ
jgi:hypothetical protein